MTPNPRDDELMELAEGRKKLGVHVIQHGWFTKSGKFEVEGIVCRKCGMKQGGWEEYDAHRREMHGIVRV